MTPAAVKAFIRRHRVVLVAAKGVVPNVADFIAREPIKGSWWGHPKGHEIFRLLEQVTASADVLVCRLVDGKQTLVHRTVWPALVRLAAHFPADRISRVEQRHTAAGFHRSSETAFPAWVPAGTSTRAAALSEAKALAALGSWARAAIVGKLPPQRRAHGSEAGGKAPARNRRRRRSHVLS